jgi:hypothetical protein
MNYIKPEDIKEYVSKNPEGIAGMSEELAVMVNHFAELIVKECLSVISKRKELGKDFTATEECKVLAREIKHLFELKNERTN